ncbi:MAG: CpXC domain-containing protein [Alphaproteobacteria bacterium]|nr:CpXC domain-containing protein [Alphaproteobacteria bacterium]
MSISELEALACDHCGATIRARVFTSVNAERHPHLRDEILARRFHVFACPTCGQDTLVDGKVLYLDLGRRQLLGVYPRDRMADAATAAQEVFETWQESFVEGPPPTRPLAKRMLVRVCFGLEELREKLVIDAAGLVDLYVEALKAGLLAGDPRFAALQVTGLSLDAVTPEGALRFIPLGLGRATDGKVPLIEIPEKAYAEMAGRRGELLAAKPCLASGPHVSVARLVLAAEG